MSTFLLVCVSTIGFIILFFVLLRIGSAGLRKAAARFTSALKDREFDTAYNMLAPDFKAYIDRQAFEDYLIQHKIFDIKEVKNYLGDYSVGLKSGTITPIIVRKDSTYFSLIIDMVKIDGKWFVYSLSTNVQLMPSAMQNRAGDQLKNNSKILHFRK